MSSLDSPAPDPHSAEGELQFDRAEFTAASPGPACSQCQGSVSQEYYEFGGKVFCAPCRQRIEDSLGRLRKSGSLARGILYGIGGGVAGAVLFYAVSALTGYQFGLIAIVVGWLVGKAVRKGSGSLGGLRYQIAAVLLTYASIAATRVPEIASYYERAAAKAEAGVAANPSTAAPGTVRTQVVHVGSVRFYILVFVLALALPILGITRDILGAVIIGIALWEAWKFTGAVKVQFKGPFNVAPAQASGA